jgi:parvulin-like peptidyl-prolyl isomerase
MIYKKLQDLVDQALSDDVITAEEESRLMARAREMGQDLDEFKSYLEGRKKQRAAWLAEQEKRENRPAYVKLAETIARVESYSKKSWSYSEKKERIQRELGEVIIPTNQEGLFQLANYLFSKYSHGKFAYIYKSRLKECLSAGKLSFPDDKRFESLETAFKETGIKRLKTIGILAGSIVVIILIIIILANVL